jgi:hypothetical protein
VQAKERAQMISKNARVALEKREEKAEIAEWFKIWLETPQIFASWLALRKRSPDFQERFLSTEKAEK